MGDPKKDFTYKVRLVCKEGHTNIRHNSMESARLVINRVLQKYLGNDYNFVVNTFPHHILRENKMLTGAGADRMQTGMSHAFGKPVGRAARIKKSNTTLMTIKVNENGLKFVKDSLHRAIPRLPGKYSIEIEKKK